jgi:DNA-3-methyladenine glycosylase II
MLRKLSYLQLPLNGKRGNFVVFTEKLVINPLAPFDFVLSSKILSYGDVKVRSFRDGIWSQVLNVDGQLVRVKLSSNGSIDLPELTLELQSDAPLSKEQTIRAKETVNCIFSLNLPLKDFYNQIKPDKVMTQITQKLYGLKFPTTATVFEALVYAIVEQQISIKVARSIEERLALKFGEQLQLGDETFFAFPTSEALAKAGAEEVRQTGLSLRKADYICGAAKLVVDGKLDIENLHKKKAETIISELDEIKGIGVWTAELTMLRGMQKFDALPADDLGIRRVISRYYCGERLIQADEARRIAEPWGDWKGLAAFYLLAAEANDLTLE